jgi:dipeptidyl aminopeptidase/acylaminoacyl peptidase
MTLIRRAVVPEDLLRLRFVSDPQISPDGRRIAFVVTTLSKDRDEYTSNVWIVETDGGTPRRFTSGHKRDTAPRWAPDGTRLAFVSDREPRKRSQLYVIPADGGEAVRVTDLKKEIYGGWGAAWSPDSTRLVFTSLVGGWEEPEDEEERGRSRPARIITTAKYKYDGEGFIHDRRPQVFVVSALGGDAQQITEGDFHHGWPTWSPDGTAIAFASERHETRDDDWSDDIYMVGGDGRGLRRLTDTAGPMWYPMFSPDGRSVVYVGTGHPTGDGRNFRLFSVSLDGGKPVCLTADLDYSQSQFVRPVWSGDGRDILAVFRDHGNNPIYRITPNGSRLPIVVVGGDRVITGLSVARVHGRIAFTATNPLAPAEVFVCDTDGTNERQLTNLNGPWTEEVALSRPERFTIHRAGFDIEGWVMKPPAFDPSQRYPALLWIHGGPHGEFGHYYSHEFQAEAGAGYVVIYTNPRGSQSYGEAFSRAVVGDWGGGDFADIMVGLDEALRRHGFIDADRLGIIGISYGGYLTSWAIAHTGRFKAACSEGAINNVHTQFGTSDIGHIWNVGESGGVLPWQDMQWYAQHSPLTHVQNVRTPLLIIHAENDLRCPIDQGEQMFIALKKLGRDVTFVRFPDESHAFAAMGRPRHRLERHRVVLDWFAKYLKPRGTVPPVPSS